MSMTCARKFTLAAGTALVALPALAADITRERLINPEPQNWLMNHRTYDGQRYSPLDSISKANVTGLKLVYAVALGGSAGNEFVQATALAEDGFLYLTDSWGVLYKIDGTSGAAGRIVWRMDPKQEKQTRNRGAALSGNFVISAASGPPRIIATDKDTGKIAWESSFSDTPEVELTSAPLAVNDKIIVGAAGAIKAFATGLPDSTPRPAGGCGAISRFRHQASRAAKPGRTKTTPGRPAAAPCGLPEPLIRQPTRPSGVPATLCRCTIRPTARATICTPTA